MKISELVKRTGVPKESIHYYIRSGILRKPRNATVNSADYGESWVERLRTIRDLRETYFLPVPVIKRIFSHLRRLSPVRRTAAFLRHKYVRPLDHLLRADEPHEADRDRFLAETGMAPEWLAKMEDWNIITPLREGETLRYSADDLTLGRLIVDMDRFGMGPREGYDPEHLREITDLFRDMFARGRKRFIRMHNETLPKTDILEHSRLATELMGIYAYLLFRKFTNEANRNIDSVCPETRISGQGQGGSGFQR